MPYFGTRQGGVEFVPMDRGAKSVGVALLLAVAATCVLATAPSALAAGGEVLSTQQVITALAREGVGVYVAPTSTQPVTPISTPAVPIRVLTSQAALYAAETESGSGTSGAELNSLAPMPAAPAGKVYPTFDYLLAAYARSTATPGEVLAGHLLAGRELSHPNTVVFPDLVMTLFAADADRAARGSSGQPVDLGSGRPVDAAATSGSPCASLANWVSSGFQSVFNALTVSHSSNPVLEFIGGLWNRAVSLAQTAIANVATQLTDAVLGVIRPAIATVGVAAWAVSALRNLQVTSVASPPFNSFAIAPASPLSGSLTITVGNANGFDWPSSIAKCAEDFGVQLPSLNSVVGRTVSWTLTQDHGTPVSTWCLSGQCDLATEDPSLTSGSLSSAHTAKFAYTTNTETADQVARGKKILNDYALVEATVSLDRSKLQALIKGIVLGGVPGAVRIVAGPMFNSLTQAVLGQIASLAEPKFFRFVQITHYATPPLLPARGCKGVLSIADFPGTNSETDFTAPDGGSECVYTGGSPDAPIAGGDALWVDASTTDAHTFYGGVITNAEKNESAQLSAVPDIGDEAVVGTGCVLGGCGPLGIVRVANDVMWVASNQSGTDIKSLLSKEVTAVCPTCVFPTSPPGN